MADRGPVKREHERAVVREFLAWLNPRLGTSFEVVTEPDPPDAVIRSAGTTRWVEVTDAFWTDEYARDLNSYATSRETHKPVGSGPFCGMDRSFAFRFTNALANKLRKRSYLTFLKMYGRGYLLIPVHHPWFDESTIEEMRNAWQPVENLGCFEEVYIVYSSLGRSAYQAWPV